jgi:hypothetical protein
LPKPYGVDRLREDIHKTEDLARELTPV